MRPFLLAGHWETSAETLPVTDPWSGQTIDEVGVASWDDVERAIVGAERAFEQTRKQTAYERAQILLGTAAQIRARREELVGLIVHEGGKPRKFATSEVDRAVSTMTWAGEEAKRLTGELIRLDTEAAFKGRLGLARRFPIGPVLGITPFNFPLNLVCHKVGPALGAGNPIIVKPAPGTPLTSLVLGEMLLAAGATDEISVLPCSVEDTQRAVADARVRIVTFTGSTPVGWQIKQASARKRVTLELGGNAPAIVEPDADLEHAVSRIAFGGFYQAGQSCVATQRVLLHEDIAARALDMIVAAVEALNVGDPNDANTDVGPLIDVKALDRVDAWVREAIDGGARALCGAKREDPVYMPTVLAGVEPSMKVSRQEIFGPVITVQTYGSFDEALAIANDSEFGLQAAVFTNELPKVFRAHREIRAGGVIHNDVSAFRADQMPYGGVKASGAGKEGLRYAMEEMTEMRLLVLSGVDL
ncbi:MAG: aldehyde dehydrogenase family protein [Actinomycetota bacterium]